MSTTTQARETKNAFAVYAPYRAEITIVERA